MAHPIVNFNSNSNSNSNSNDPVWKPRPANRALARHDELEAAKLAKLHEDEVQEMAEYFGGDIENLLREIVTQQKDAKQRNDNDAYVAYGALYTLAHRIYEVFESNYRIGLEPLMLNLLRVMNGVYIKSPVTGRDFFVDFNSEFEPEQINKALELLVEMTIGELPKLAADNYELVKNIVNPIVETADSLIERFGAWLAPAVTHINDRLFAYVSPAYEHAIEKIPKFRVIVEESLRNLPTIEKIYLGDSIIQVINFTRENVHYLIGTLCQSSSFAKMVADFGVGTIETILGGIESIRRSLMAIQGMSFNLLVFTIVLTQQIYKHHGGNDQDLGKYLKDLCITYASRALFKIRGAYAETEHGREVAIKYGNIIYHSIKLTINAVKQIHLLGYAANPLLLSGFFAYAVARYINSFHNDKISLGDAFLETYRTVFGEELPKAAHHVIEDLNKLGTQIKTQVDQIEANAEAAPANAEAAPANADAAPANADAAPANAEAAQALLALMNNMSEPAQDQGVDLDPKQVYEAHQAAITAGLLQGVADPNNRMTNSDNNGMINSDNNNNNGPTDGFGGGKARRRKTIKKKHTKKAHKGKSKKSGKVRKVRKVKKARKSKVKKAHKGKRRTKRRS